MSAIVVDLKDMGVRTPEQAVRVFFENFGPEEVRVGLWEAFRGFALASEAKTDKALPDIEDVAMLFDGLISLANGIYDLRIKTSGSCVICGRRGMVVFVEMVEAVVVMMMIRIMRVSIPALPVCSG